MSGSEHDPIPLALPFRGRWLARNSPANRLPSHGTRMFSLERSIDLVPVDRSGRTAPLRPRSLLRTEPPEVFPGFGREVLSPVDGVVHLVHDGETDHPAHRGLPSIGYALTQGRRAAEGWRGLAGNHVILRGLHRGAAYYAVLCHLRRGSLAVRPGQEVRVGDLLAECGNSGNSSEPHLHLQVMSTADPSAARALAFTFLGGLPRNGQVIDAP